MSDSNKGFVNIGDRVDDLPSRLIGLFDQLVQVFYLGVVQDNRNNLESYKSRHIFNRVVVLVHAYIG